MTQALVWVGPVALFVVLLPGAVNRWIRPVELGSLVDSGMMSLLFPIALLALLAVAIENLAGDTGLALWRRSVGASAAGVLGGVLLVSAWAKVLDPRAFAGTISAEGLDFLLPATLVAYIALALEVGLGAGLVLGVRLRSVLATSAALVAFFLVLTGRAYLRFLNGIVDEDASCGCFGNLVERTPAQAFWQDFILLVPPLVLSFMAVRRAAPRVRLIVVCVLTAFTLGFAWAAPSLPLDDLATRLRPGVEIADICSGADERRVCLPSLEPEIQEGAHLVVMTRLDDETFVEAVEDLNAYFLAGQGPTLKVLSSATTAENQAFFWSHGPSFRISETPEPLMRPLYRALPRSFRTLDGVVVETWAGLPPLDELAATATD